MNLFEIIRRNLAALPRLAKSAVALAIIVGIPPLAWRVRIPGVVGLLLAGVVLGPHGLKLLPEQGNVCSTSRC